MKKLIPLVERLFSLLVVFLLLAAATLWSGKFFGMDWLHSTAVSDEIKVAVAAPSAKEKFLLGLSGKSLVPKDSISWNVMDGSVPNGIVISSQSFSGDIVGYAGSTPLFVYIDEAGKIQHIVAMENDETPGFFRRAKKGMFVQWKGLTVKEALETEVDAVTGATYSSQSLIQNMQAVLSAYAATDLRTLHEPAIGWGRTIALFLVFGLGLVVSWRYRGHKRLRLQVMVLNVGVTGFWCGQFLSLSILHGWIQNGIDVVLYLPTVVMLVMAILLPYFGKPNHYCNWMCPYGSLQELMWQLPVPKIKVGAKVYKRMAQLRMFVLMVLLFSLWMGFGFAVLDYEPFSAFIITTASPAVMVLAGIFVLTGIFIPHPWCRCICPVGALLNLAEEKK